MIDTIFGRRESGTHRELRLCIDIADGGPAETEHLLIAPAVAQGRLTLDDANAIAAKLVRPATYLWKDE
jgi:hypothetical protein